VVRKRVAMRSHRERAATRSKRRFGDGEHTENRREWMLGWEREGERPRAVCTKSEKRKA
jgi:hypothetical protein